LIYKKAGIAHFAEIRRFSMRDISLNTPPFFVIGAWHLPGVDKAEAHRCDLTKKFLTQTMPARAGSGGRKGEEKVVVRERGVKFTSTANIQKSSFLPLRLRVLRVRSSLFNSGA